MIFELRWWEYYLKSTVFYPPQGAATFTLVTLGHTARGSHSVSVR